MKKNRIKIGFYLNNGSYKDIDYSKPEEGNPGLRGTQFMIWLVSYYLNKNYNDIECIIFAESIDKMPKSLKCFECKDEIDAARIAKIENVDFFVLKVTVSTNAFIIDAFEKNGIKCITWSHNFINYPLAELLYRSKTVVYNVCVGRQQYELLRDHPIFKKSGYIYNALTFECYQNYQIPPSKKENIVMYVGALTPDKGFDQMARMWKSIKKKVPNAKLYVLGSGSLGKNEKLGSLGIASEKFEKKLRKYICTKDGNIDENIYFIGNVGGKKQRKLMASAKVGVANLTKTGETFCLVAIEFEAVGVPVVSVRYGGLLDTVRNGNDGLQSNYEIGIINSIVKLLKDNQLNEKLGKNGMKNSRDLFDINTIVSQWYSLIIALNNNERPPIDFSYDYPLNQLKWFRELNRILQTTKFGSYIPSFMETEYKFKKIVKKLIGR